MSVPEQIQSNALTEYLKGRIPRIEASLQRFFAKLRSGELGVEPLNSLLQPLELAVMAGGGKRFRSLLVYLSHDLVGGEFQRLDDAAILPELPHKGSVVEDDIEDEALERDRKDPLYISHGHAIATSVFNFLYLTPHIILENLDLDQEKRERILHNYSSLFLQARIGQGKDLEWGRSLSLPTEQEYLQMCREKNAAFEFAARTGAILGNATEQQENALAEIAGLAAVSYQIADDLLSLDPKSHDFGADIRQKKITLMVIKALKNQDAETQLLRMILLKKTDDPILINRAIAIMQHCKAIDYTKETAEALVQRAQNLLIKNFPDVLARHTLSELVAYGLSRKS